MPRYAMETSVSIENSRAEIERTLRKYNATEFHSGWKPGAHMLAFRLNNYFVRFVLPLPPKSEKRFTHKRNRGGSLAPRTPAGAESAWDQECRQRWRALALVVKAKLEAVECQISTVEQEFLSFIVMPNEITVGEWMLTNALPQIKEGKMPLLEYKQPGDAPIDADFEVKST